MLLGYMFDERRFNKCEAEVYEFNSASLAFHERFGFTQEGDSGRHEYFLGMYRDVVVMGMTAAEFRCLP